MLDKLSAGGLGDVMGALPKALARRGHRVMAVAPRYAEYEEGWETGVRIRLGVFGQEQQVSLALVTVRMEERCILIHYL